MKKFEAKSKIKADKSARVFGVNITGTELVEVLRTIGEKLKRKEKFLITTPNPEILLLAEKDIKYREILNKADIAIPDGIGLAWLTGLKVIHGRELFVEILKMLNQQSGRVYLLGGPETERAVSKLSRKYKDLKIRGKNGPELDNQGNPLSEKDKQIELSILNDISQFKPDILCMGFGAGKQEKWLDRNWNRPQIKGALAFGRTLEFFSGKYPLPPKFLEKLELEWLWRLLTGSTNLKRVWKAVVVFPWRVLNEKLTDH